MSLITTEMLKVNYDPKISMPMSKYAKAIVDTQNETVDKVLEIIDAEAWSYCDYIIKHKNGNFDMHTAASHLSNNIRDAVLALKGGEQ